MFGIFYNHEFDCLLITSGSYPRSQVATIKEGKDVFFVRTPSQLSGSQNATSASIVPGVRSRDLIGANIFSAGVFKSYLTPGSIQSDNFKLIAILNQHSPWLAQIPTSGPGQFVVGLVTKVTEMVAHEHLHVCQVELHNHDVKTVICGGNNVQQGKYVVFAHLRTVMPDQRVLVPKRWGPIVSEGMICSAYELGLSLKADGSIINLPSYYQSHHGQSFWQAYAQYQKI